ncbi:hypothetical protein N0V95_006594 [Ascochyta clinopodiicola]|nr:hypothetical protein N0V95_006594 [Ascochyta clinopodiicola]
MAYEVEDEVDWSDGTLDEPLPSSAEGPGDTINVDPITYEDVESNYLLKNQEDALYQANRKVYEATFLKHFVSHALRPSQIEECFRNSEDAYLSVQTYITAVSANINDITEKMTWNAHCRAVNLPGNAGKEDARFWDVGHFDQSIFLDFVPDNTVPVAHRMTEPKIVNDTHLHRGDSTEGVTQQAVPVGTSYLSTNTSADGSTRLERLFEELGNDALSGDHHDIDAFQNEKIEQVPIWPTRLLNDHRRRLAQKSPKVGRRALPGIRAVVGEALLQGYRPTNPDIEELIIDTETREHAEAVSALVPSKVTPSVQDTVQIVSKKQKKFTPGMKRIRDQPGIRMLNKPVESSKKRRKLDVSVLGLEGLAQSTKDTTSTSTQKPNFERPSSSEPRQPQRNCRKQKTTQHKITVPINPAPLLSHPSGSSTLELHQQLPPTAYFTPKNPFEEPVWRCGIKHAMGHYYNAGNRKNCPGCFTALSDNISAKVMDFYLPSRTHFHQPNPASRWRPSKPFGRVRRSKSLSHNSIAKEGYWSAIATGSTGNDALRIAVDAVTEHLRPKIRKEPTPVPTPEPEPDLGPHPSGSSTMEHGQDLPDCAYFSKQDQYEEFAWRCDINHALGRYYLAGDKRTCPGCGSNKNGIGKHMEMDFFMPAGIVVRQEVVTLKWKPRKPYKTREGKKKESQRTTTPSHNQIASKKYWNAVEAGKEHAEALQSAVEETDMHLDEKETEALQRIEDRAQAKAVKTAASILSTGTRCSERHSSWHRHLTTSDDDTAANYHKDLSDQEMDDAEDSQTNYGPEAADSMEVKTCPSSSSDDDTSSGSDSE